MRCRWKSFGVYMHLAESKFFKSAPLAFFNSYNFSALCTTSTPPNLSPHRHQLPKLK